MEKKVYIIRFRNRGEFEVSDWADTMEWSEARDGVLVFASLQDLREWGYGSYRVDEVEE